MKRKRIKINKDKLIESLPEIIAFIIILVTIFVAVYYCSSIRYEVSRTTGTISDKYEEHTKTTVVRTDEKGYPIGFEEVKIDNYYVKADVRDTDNVAILNSKSFYENHIIGDTVKVKIIKRYWKGEHIDTSYLIIF